MTNHGKPFSVREGLVPSRPVQIMGLDRETSARVGDVMGQFLPEMRGCSEGSVKEFFGISREEYKHGCFHATMAREMLEITVSGGHLHDEKLMREIPIALCRAKGGWRVAFDFCECVIHWQDNIIVEGKRRLREVKKCEAKDGKNTHPLGERFLAESIRERLQQDQYDRSVAIAFINETLERMNVGYRLLEKTGRFSAVTSPVEMGAVDDAQVAPFPAAREHMQKAVSLFSDRKKPDYANSIKESISAVESLVKEFTGKKMGPGLEKLRRDGFFPHSAFAEALKKHYGFASDAGGIRHAADGKSLEPDADTARFMLVTCAAFVNYMTARKSRESDSA